MAEAGGGIGIGTPKTVFRCVVLAYMKVMSSVLAGQPMGKYWSLAVETVLSKSRQATSCS